MASPVPPRHSKILVTGCSGRIGQAVVHALLQHDLPIFGFDRTPSPLLTPQQQIVGALNDQSAIQSALESVTAVIHLAATPDDADSPTWWQDQLLPNNIDGTHHFLESCKEHSIQTLLLASTGQLNWWQQFDGPWPIQPSHPLSPRHWYAATKVFMESAAYSYSRQVPNSSVVAIRLGWCPRIGQEAEFAASPVGPDVYLSPHDVGSFYLAALQKPLPAGFHVVYVTSLPTHKTIFDLTPAFNLTGWRPADRWNNTAR